jgi:hypothetical protein
MTVCFEVIEKIALDLSLVSAQYLLHFQYVLSDLKPNGCIN